MKRAILPPCDDGARVFGSSHKCRHAGRNLILNRFIKLTILPLGLFLTLAAKTFALDFQDSSVEYAARYEGATWAERVNAAVAALPVPGGTVDAHGLCVSKPLTPADTNVVLGTDKKTIRLNLGSCSYPLGPHAILYFPDTEVGGMGMNVPGDAGTTITYTGSGAGFRYGGSLRSAGVYGVFLHDFSVKGDETPGSIGIDMTYALVSTLERINTNGSDNGWRFGGAATCSCYNQLIRVLAFDRSRGGWLSRTANQNQIFGGAVRANNAGGIGLDIDGASSNQIYSLDIESSAKYSIALETNGYSPSGNAIVNPYIEAAGPILIGSGATYNSVVGTGGLFERGSVVDRSGNTTNYIHQTGGGGGTDGIWPYYEVVQNGVYFGLSPANSFKLLSDRTEPYGPLELRWSGGVIAPQYGLFGHAPLETGQAILHSGAKIAGLTTTAMIENPAAPIVNSEGPTDDTSYHYYVVCHDSNGGVTLPSPAGSLLHGNSKLGGTDFNQISWRAVDGCSSWDVLKGNINTSLAVNQHPRLDPTSPARLVFRDDGQPTSPYAAPTRNTSGDLELAGIMISSGIRWPLPARAINGGSFYCPNCDPPMTPPSVCTSNAARTGSWVHGLNGRWICVP